MRVPCKNHIKMNRTYRKHLISTACLAATGAACLAQERPNILWLTFEDTSQYEFASYGNPDVRTPITDSLASVGLRFVNAYSCGPQSSPARSTLITGCYSTTYAMDWHRSRVMTPEDIFFPQILRDAGYYCTNNQKTDYNTKLDNTSCWDECDDKATYNSPNRKEGQPFFAVFNSGLTHMSRLTSAHIEGRRDFAAEGLDPAGLALPPHVPDEVEVRSDYAFHLEGVQDVDTWVGIFLKDLKDKGLDDNTIVFVFSDHGGCLPRGKAFSYESSFRVPMFVYIPDRWKALSDEKRGKACERLVSFCDLGPTVLSIAGIRPPERMQGKAFMGEFEAPARTRQIGYMTNRTIHFAPSRSISDGRYKYIRNYIPYKMDALYNYFQWQMPANLAWDRAWQEGRLRPEHLGYFQASGAEEFYDLKNDPYELNNLIGNKKYRKVVEGLRQELSEHLRSSMDIGLLPVTAREGEAPYDRVRKEGYDNELFYSLAELTATVTAGDISHLISIINGIHPQDMKFWAVVNLAVLSREGRLPSEALSALESMLSCGDYMTEQEAAYALCHTSRPEAGIDYLAAHPEMTSALELLALEPDMRFCFNDKVMSMLNAESQAYEAKKWNNKMPNGGAGINARKVLINLGFINAMDLYGPNVHKAGEAVNKKVRALKPVPVN